MKRLAIVISGAALVLGTATAVSAATAAKPRARAATHAGKPAPPAQTSGATSADAALKASGAVPNPPTSQGSADSAYTLKGSAEGTVFKSLTVEGEDRIRYDIERPPLHLDLDPSKAPGLDWGSARDVLDRTVPDFASPLVTTSSHDPCPWIAHPWLSSFASGAVARFKPELKGVERWKLTIVNARGEAVATYQGRGEPPHEIAWDGRSQAGAPVVPGLTYSYVLEAHDRAGNKRNFVGQGFKVSAYRLDTPEGPMLAFAGRELPTSDPRRPATGDAAAVPLLIEAATWVNQAPNPNRPVRVTASARSYDEAQALGATVAKQMAPFLIGDPARLQTAAEVRPDAPEGGMVVIACVK
ncbi:MAG: hypothetical protein E6K80_06430 [Candidatus Eisenbacteria bacterium]|uniref:FlgD Ig-like domain-containing protein n=1 Tax=Eiseniibacteriota bacterium TaxID=2212470 RepID=A0A538U5H7_UNCEI|nr:MAG: hypothetical protein E6K80_06430 [Candidatus Eisenbacteria bacterium]